MVCAEFQIAYPVAWDGERHHEHIPLQQLHATWRRKRSLSATPSFHVNLTAFGHHFHLELWENKDLLAPGFKIYRRHPRGPPTAAAAQTVAPRTEEEKTKVSAREAEAAAAASRSEIKDSGSGEVKDAAWRVKADGKTTEVRDDGERTGGGGGGGGVTFRESFGSGGSGDEVGVGVGVGVGAASGSPGRVNGEDEAAAAAGRRVSEARKDGREAADYAGRRSEVRAGGVGVLHVSSQEEVDLELSCLVTGRVRSHGDTPVALSLCHGMVSSPSA